MQFHFAPFSNLLTCKAGNIMSTKYTITECILKMYYEYLTL